MEAITWDDTSFWTVHQLFSLISSVQIWYHVHSYNYGSSWRITSQIQPIQITVNGYDHIGFRGQKNIGQLFWTPFPPKKLSSKFSIFFISFIFYYFLKPSLYGFSGSGKSLVNFLLTPRPPLLPQNEVQSFHYFSSHLSYIINF